MANHEHERLRNEARKRQRAAGQKISRIERHSDVRINKSPLDPRRPAADINAMGTRELRNYIKNLNSFTDRSNQYVAGLEGSPIRRSTAQAIERVQGQVNALAQAQLEQFGQLKVPGSGLTIAQRLATLAPKDQVFSGGGWNRVFQEQQRDMSAIAGEDSAQRILKNLGSKLNLTYFAREMKIQRDVMLKKLAALGNNDAYDTISKLNNFQLNILFDNTEFRNATDIKYDELTSTNTDSSRWQSEVSNEADETISEVTEWAKTLPKNGKQSGATNRVSLTPQERAVMRRGGNINETVHNAHELDTKPKPKNNLTKAEERKMRRGGKL